jgi:hypothetical protein
MDNRLTPQKQDAVIEDALHSYPVLPLPRDITMDVMSRIQTLPTPRPFRLTWNDVLLSAVFALCMGALWFSLQNLPPLAVAQIRKESILLYQQILLNARWLIPLIAFSLAGFLLLLTIPFLRRERVE